MSTLQGTVNKTAALSPKGPLTPDMIGMMNRYYRAASQCPNTTTFVRPSGAMLIGGMLC